MDGSGYDVLSRKSSVFQVRISIFLVCDLGELIL